MPSDKEIQRIIANMERWREHPWAAIADGVIITLDPKSLREPIRKFPTQPWLREITELWVNEPKLAIPKSRQMLTSWLMVWCHLWLAMFHEGAAVYLQSDKEDKSNELVQRCEFIYNHFPPGEIILPKLKQGRATWCSMVFSGLNSFIKGIAQGADQLRQYAASAVLMDEAAFWEKGRESFAATKPTIDGGGRVTVISSARSGWMKDLCWDTVT
jgi:hypothetical protein